MTITARRLHQDLARSIAEALVGLESAPEPLVVQPAHKHAPAVEQLRAGHLHQLSEALQDARDQLEGAEDERNRVHGQHRRGERNEADLKRAERAVGRAAALVQKCEDELAAAQVEPQGRVVEEELQVRTVRAEFVVAALEACPGTGPEWLREACRALIQDFRIRVVTCPGVRTRGLWSATLVLPTEHDHEQLRLPISGEVLDNANAAKDATSGCSRVGPEALGWGFFYGGETFSALGTAAGIDGSGDKNTYLYKQLSDFLDAKVPDPAHRTAALDVQVPATRRALWTLITKDVEASAEIDAGFVGHIANTYAGPARHKTPGWCRDTHALARKASSLLLAAGGSMSLADLVEQLGVSQDVVVALARVDGSSPKGADLRRTLHAVSPLLKNWCRGRPKDPNACRLSLRPCPHADCPEALRGSQGFASWVIWTPETELGHGVLCPSCRRLPVPALSHVRFPPDYLRPWSGRFGKGSHGHARRHQGSFIDGRQDPDPGPSPALSDTGALPRPDQPVHGRAGYMTKAQREASILGGDKVLILGVEGDTLDQLQRRVRDLGGQLGTRVKPSVRCVVVRSDSRRPSPQLERAEALGLEVLTCQQFLARSDEAWRATSRTRVAA